MIRCAVFMLFLVCLWGIPQGSRAGTVGDPIPEVSGSRGTVTLSKRVLESLFHRYVCSSLRKPGSDVLVSRFRVTGMRRGLRRGGVNVRLYRKDGRRLTGNVHLTAIVSARGSVVGKMNLSAWVDVFQQVVCARRNLKKGTVIGAGDLYLSRKNLSRLSRDILKRIDGAVGLRVRHSVKADTCIKRWMLERPPAVERGDRVTILAESGALRITVPGKVLEKGYPGGLVRVRNMMSRKEIFARVVDNLTVRVDF